MGRHRRRRGELGEGLRALQDHAGAAQALAAPVPGIAHGPVEAEPVAVDPCPRCHRPLVDLAVGAAALLRIPVADLGVAHDPAPGHLAALVGCLGGLANLGQEGGGPDGPGLRQRPAGRQQLRPRRQLLLGNHHASLEWEHDVAQWVTFGSIGVMGPRSSSCSISSAPASRGPSPRGGPTICRPTGRRPFAVKPQGRETAGQLVTVMA